MVHLSIFQRNYAVACVVMFTERADHIRPVLQMLHRLPIKHFNLFQGCNNNVQGSTYWLSCVVLGIILC